jgi:hypothetical protein
MAHINGEWLSREQRAERIDLLTERVRKLASAIKAGKATDYHIDTFRKDKEELKRLKRIHRAEVDVAYFFYAYLSDGSNPGNEDNVIRNSDDGTPHDDMYRIAPIHRDFFEHCDYVNDVERNARLAIAAARGHNKSGTYSNGFPLHQIVYRRRKYVLIISETDSLSKKLIGWINKQLKFNALLREDFGILLHERSQQNEKDNEEAFITTSNTLIEASSSGKQLRGEWLALRYGNVAVINRGKSVKAEMLIPRGAEITVPCRA